MYQTKSVTGTSEQRTLAVYRRHRNSGNGHRAAYAAAMQEFRRLNPEATAFHAMGALKEALWREPESGIVDSTAAGL